MDFITFKQTPKKGIGIYVAPDFAARRSNDLMTKGQTFYAVYDSGTGLWCTDKYRVYDLVDQETLAECERLREKNPEEIYIPQLMYNYSTGLVDMFNKFVKSVDDNYKDLNSKMVFANSTVVKEDYASFVAGYSLAPGSTASYDELVSKLYDPEQREKFEWAIGSVIAGDSSKIQKFIAFYGAPKTGKSTVLNIIEKLFEGYKINIDIRSLTDGKDQFAMGGFSKNPLICVQHDGDLSNVKDLTKLNSLVSHERQTVNEKFKSRYESTPKTMIFMGTNEPIDVSNDNSGLNRRLLDVNPTGKRHDKKRYDKLWAGIDFELGAIAYHCLKVYESMGPDYYHGYVPYTQKSKTDYMYNFVRDQFERYCKGPRFFLFNEYSSYKTWSEKNGLKYLMTRIAFREALSGYFEQMIMGESGECTYEEFKDYKFRELYNGPLNDEGRLPEIESESDILDLSCKTSLFDDMAADWDAQYAIECENEPPSMKWADVTTKLRDIHTERVHYVKVPHNHIVIDFDLKDENGNKSKDLNLKAAAKFPKTYAEFSKGGNGVHLHYIYDGDPDMLESVYAKDIEIKVYKGNSALRRRVSYCNDIPVAHICTGLPVKKEAKKVVDKDRVVTEVGIRKMIQKNLKKEIHPSTKSSVDFIHKILSDAYNSGAVYDVSDMLPAVLAFASNSTHQAGACIKLVNDMKFKSEATLDDVPTSDELPIIFYDVEVFKNLFIIVWKTENGDCVKMINPEPQEVADWMTTGRLIGFNNRRYDNHIVYARSIGYSLMDLYNLSVRLIEGLRDASISEAYNLSYTDIYDFASAAHKQSLKKFEIELGIHHQENSIPWDQEVPKDRWEEIANYCCNDVIATQAVWVYLKGDWAAREILSEVAESTPNDTTNSLTTKIIFGRERKPQNEFYYRNLAEPVTMLDGALEDFIRQNDILPIGFTAWDGTESLLPCFPGYTFDNGVSEYRGVKVGEGGYVYAEPGMYEDVALLDVASMHPSSIIAECLFGPDYTNNFKDIRDSRICIKHNDMESLSKLLGGRLCPYLNPEKYDLGDLSNALKTAINSVYGLTSASFPNAFKDPRNMDNIVAKRGALFMVDLMNAVKERGFTVAHIKTDSIKIPNATREIIEFVMAFGKKYGYTFEHEATYRRMCLVNNAVYIAQYASKEHCEELYGEDWVNADKEVVKKCKKKPNTWEATGAEFQHPYIYKTLFTGEDTAIDDMKEVKSVQTSISLDMNENLPEGSHDYRYIGKIGCFVPIQQGCGGGELVRVDKSGVKYSSVTGAKGYRWLEFEEVKTMGYENYIDYSLHETMVREAVEHMKEFGDPAPYLCDRYLSTHSV